MTLNRDNGIVNKPSNHSVDETVQKVRESCRQRGSICSRSWTTAEKPKKWG